jgi:sigma-B regulation protein RsbU (phosphoserine phosphatase)
MKRKTRKIRSKILAVILSTVLIPLVALGTACVILLSEMKSNAIETNHELGTTASKDSASALRTQIEGDLTARAAAIADSVDAKLLQIENQTRVNAKYVEKLYTNPENYPERPLDYLKEHQVGTTVPHIRTAEGVDYDHVLPEISLLGNAADVLDEFLVTGINVSANYIGTETGVFVTVDTTASGPNRTNYDPRTRSWYIGAKESGELFWTDIFADASGRGASISCAMPIYADGKLKAVAGTGATLEKISEIVRGAAIGENGYAFLLNQRGEVVITPHAALVTDAQGNITGENYLESDDFTISHLAESMTNGQSGVRQITLDGEDVIVAFAPLKRTGWSIGAVIPNTEAIAPVTTMQKVINGLIGESETAVHTHMTAAITVIIVAVAVALALSVILSFRFSKTISEPISILTKEAEEIGKGNLENTITITTGDELEELAGAFNKMTEELKLYIENLQTVTVDNDRISAELEVASKIQTAMLPHIFSPSPDCTEFDIYCSMSPAKVVGGDFYDFFLVGEKTLAFVIADVAGKGVAAALFMVIAKTLIKNNAQMNKSPKQVFEEVNNVLCGNDDGMFVTAFMGYLDAETGELTYVNAGHYPPCIQHSETGDWEFLSCKPGFVLAGMENMSYKQQTVTLQKGEKLYLYTDGVTEAQDKSNGLYGKKRLITTLNAHKEDNVMRLVNSIKDDIKDFTRGAEQSDDITMLALEFLGKAEEEA